MDTRHQIDRRILFRKGLLAMLCARAILISVALLHASLLVRSSFGDAFLLSPGQSFHSSSLARKSVDTVFRRRNINSRGNWGETPSTSTATNVFSRLGEAPASSGGGTTTTLPRRRTTNEKDAPSATRGYCPRCMRPNVVCVCHALPEEPIDCGTRILILQHPREAKKRKRTSTVPLIGLSLDNVEICVGTTFAEGSHPLLDEALAIAKSGESKNHALLLYPSDRALPLQDYLEKFEASREDEGREEISDRRVQKSILVVVDGTWAQTQTMVQNSISTLQQLPSVMFDDKTNSLFDSLRQEPAEHCTSTLEAVARAIRLLGQSSTFAREAADALERSLEAMVDGQLRFANDEKVAKPRYYRKNETDLEGISKRQVRRTRKLVSKKLQASVSLARPKTKEELEMDRIKFVYIAHMG